VKYLLSVVLVLTFTNAMLAQQPTKVVSSAGNFSVSLPPGERKDETVNLAVGKHAVEGRHAFMHSFATIQYNKSFIAIWYDYSAVQTAWSFDLELKDAATKGVVTDIKGGTRQGHAFITYSLTYKLQDTQAVESRFSMSVGKCSYRLIAIGPIYDSPTSKEIADFFNSFNLLVEDAH
jgi:hypothetical protein